MSVLRFPNSQSDVNRLVTQMALVAKRFPSTTSSFTLDEMRDVLAEEYQISSSGASGLLAVEKSTRKDRSRDPLYNQVKMMSELYRMVGWFRSLPGNRLVFRLTNLGLTVAIDSLRYGAEVRMGLVRESLLRVVFPNTTTNNVGVTNQRPFAWLLGLASALDGFITRDEIIVGVLGVIDDRRPGMMDEVLQTIIRSRRSGISAELVREVSEANAIQVNTLQNYTRFPIGVLSSDAIGWARKSSRRLGPKNEKRPVFELTDAGRATAEGLSRRFDLRAEDIASLSLEERGQVADFAFYETLALAGIPVSDLGFDMERGRRQVDQLLSPIGFDSSQTLLYNPELQESDSLLESLME